MTLEELEEYYETQKTVLLPIRDSIECLEAMRQLFDQFKYLKTVMSRMDAYKMLKKDLNTLMEHNYITYWELVEDPISPVLRVSYPYDKTNFIYSYTL